MYRLQTEGLDRVDRAPDHVEGSRGIDLADHGRLRQMVIGVHHDLKAARRFNSLTVHRLPDGVYVGGAGLGHGLRPHPKADEGGFHRVIRRLVPLLVEVRPHFHERVVFRRLDGLEIIPCRELAGQTARANLEQFAVADRERHHRKGVGVHLLGDQLPVEMRVGVSVDGRYHRGPFSFRTESLDPCDDLAPVGMPERRVDRRDILGCYAFVGEIGAQDLVGGPRIDIVGAEQNPPANLAAILAHQVADRRNRLLAWRSAGVENVSRAFFALILHGIEQQAVQLLEDRKNRLSGHGGPAAEYDRDLLLREQLARLFGEGVPVRRRIDDDRLQLLAEQPAFFVLIRDHHQDRVLQHGLADGHGAGQGMQNADLDGVFGGVSRRTHRERAAPRASLRKVQASFMLILRRARRCGFPWSCPWQRPHRRR